MRGCGAELFLVLTLASGGVAHAAFDQRHAQWTALLAKHVVLIDGGKASRVDYTGFVQDRKALQTYLAQLSAVTESEFDGWSKAERKAFLINAYNAHTVAKVLTRYPGIRSIWDFGKVFGNPFRDRFFTLLGRPMSLDGIEHETLRKPGAYDEPRIHFAVNCASIGCPMLAEEAYTGGKLEAQLERQARRFLSDRSRNRYDARSGALEVSKIFDWYGEDFGPLPRYFSRYAELLADSPDDRSRVKQPKVQVRHLEYDWTLNDTAPPGSTAR